MMNLPKIALRRGAFDAAAAKSDAHLLLVFPVGKTLPQGLPGGESLAQALARRAAKPESLAKSPLAANLPGGAFCAWVAWDGEATRFARLTALRKAVGLLLGEGAKALQIVLVGPPAMREAAGLETCYVAGVNGVPLPSAKRKPERQALRRLELWGGEGDLAAALAVAEGNLLARELTSLPPNVLDPKAYRARLRKLAKSEGWAIEELGLAELRRLKAGAFLAVAQGSADEAAAIVRLSYVPRGAKRKIALVGKGICFDTGGHNLKPARYMAGMHEDMAGSAVVLGILLAATRLKLPLRLDAWLAIARNQLSPQAYAQGDVVHALNGTSIEVVHTDAEGRMVLADTLSLAARQKPELIVDFATLTGSMIGALGARHSGVLTNADELARRALAAGEASGERVVVFPLADDYDSELESAVADVKQCTLAGEADHILAGLFLKRFVAELPWVHMDLSAANCKGGLGAVATDVTGFGVDWGVRFLSQA